MMTFLRSHKSPRQPRRDRDATRPRRKMLVTTTLFNRHFGDLLSFGSVHGGPRQTEDGIGNREFPRHTDPPLFHSVIIRYRKM